jgi:two-component sensor histidine kinase
MPNYKSVEAYQTAKTKSQNQEAKQQAITLAQNRVNQLSSLHSQLCNQHGDSGSVRQQLEDAESHLEGLKNG